MIGFNGGLIGLERTAGVTSSVPGVWTLPEQLQQRRARRWPLTEDPDFDKVSLLLHGNGTNNSTTILDSSIKQWAINSFGNASISTDQSKHGGASIKLDGTGDYLTISNPSNDLIKWDVSDSAFTVECFVYVVSFTQSGNSPPRPVMIGNCSPTTDTSYWTFGPLSNGTVAFFYWTGAQRFVSTTSTISVNTWNHLAMVRSGTTITVFINGVSSATASVIGTPQFASATGLTVGSYRNVQFNGYIDDLRISGVARYESNFTPPTSQFPSFD